jgi:hypothetical protein
VFTAASSTTSTGIPNIIKPTLTNGPGTIVTIAATDNGTYNRVGTSNLEYNGTELKKAQTAQLTINPNKFASFNSDGIVAWGQMTDGSYDTATQNNKIVMLDYIAGATPKVGALASLTGSYKVFASTAPFLISGRSVSTVGAANTTSGQLDFNFSNSTFAYGLSVLAANQTYVLGGGGSLIAGSPNFYGNNNQSSIVGGGCIVNGCSGALNNGTRLVQGSFLGVNGERIGLQYGFNVPSGAIYGGAVLK